jgi:hypothetical protein
MTTETNLELSNSHSEDIPTLLSIRQFADKHKFMSESSLRWLLFRDPTGLEECIVRTSPNRLYIDEKKFFAFLRNRDPS